MKRICRHWRWFLGACCLMGCVSYAPRAPRGELFTGGSSPLAIGDVPRGLDGINADDCARCHPEIAEEWRSSLHAMAWTDPIFRAEYDPRPEAPCRHCHAPRATTPRVSGGAADGVDCAVCHVRDGRVMAARDHPEGCQAVADPRLVQSDFCGGCHQFNFLDDGVHDPSDPMQDTLAEWTRSESAAQGQRCQSCHMPRVTGPEGNAHRSHRFPGLSDRALLANAVQCEVTARREGSEIVVTAIVRPGLIGHAFPTGDLFRWARLSVWTDVEHPSSAVLERHFAYIPSSDETRFAWRQIDDTRCPPPGGEPPFSRELRLEADDADDVQWSLDLFRAPEETSRRRGFTDEQIRVRFAEGTAPIISQ